MATKYKVSTEFSILDRASSQLDKMAKNGSVAARVMGNGIADAQKRWDAFGATVKSVSKAAIVGGIGAISAGLVVATKEYANFEQAIRAAGAAYGPAFSTASDFNDKLGVMGKEVRKVAATTEFNATEAANALKTLALAGVKSEQAIGLLPGVADLATASMTSMDEAVALAVGSLNTMGLMSDDPNKLAANMTTLSDVMAHTANSAYMSLQDVGAAISSGGSFFKTANNNMYVMSGSLTALANNSIRGAEAGVHLRNIMTNLSAPTAAAQKALSKMNIVTKDAAGNMLPLPKIIGQMEKAMAGMGDIEKNANLYAIFGKQNIAAVTALLNTGQGKLEEYTDAASRATGTIVANAEAMRGSLVNKFKVLLSALTEVGFKFVDAFAVKGGNALDSLTKAISEFDPTPLVNAAVSIVNVLQNIVQTAWKLRGPILFIVGTSVAWKTLTFAIVGVMKAMQVVNIVTSVAKGIMIAHKAAVVGTTVAVNAANASTMAAAIGMKLYGAGAAIATAAQWLLNAAMSANPIALVIIGITALIGIILVLTNKWKAVTAAVDGFFAKIHEMKGVGGVILNFLVSPLEVVWKMVRSVFDIFAAFKEGGFINGIKMIGLSILQFICAPLQGILNMLSFIPGIGGLSDKMNSWFENTRANLLNGSSTDEAGGLPAESAQEAEIATAAPTQTAAQANSYSREETVTTNQLQIGLEKGLTVTSGTVPAPAFTLNTGRR